MNEKTELPPDIAEYIGNAMGREAAELREKYSIEKPLPEWLKYTTYLHHDPDEYVAPELFLANGIELDEADWGYWEEKIGRPFYEVGIEWSFNTKTGKVRFDKIDRKTILND